MARTQPAPDPAGLLEYSVVYTDRALNHMSAAFQQVMRDLSSTLKDVYRAHSLTVIPGSGTFAMEAVARQFATGKQVLVVRNGWFSFRWTQIFDMGGIPAGSTVLCARPTSDAPLAPFAPPPVEEVVAAIRTHKPELVFAPHVETSSGIVLPDYYLKQIADAVHGHGGLFVLDAIASGALWVDMKTTGVDVLISAPQKGWSGPACAGLVLLSEAAHERMLATTSTSFSCDLGRWAQIMDAYQKGGHAYHATMPTDALRAFRDAVQETGRLGFDNARQAQLELGGRIRRLLADRGYPSVAAPGFEAAGVVVSYTSDPAMKSGQKFAAAGLQIAAGVPLRCGEPDDFSTFRLGLFGLDKLQNVDRTVALFEKALDQIG